VSNFVASADGRATVSGRTAPLSGAADKEIFQLLRTEVDAVLVGAETVRVERYGALATIKELRELRLREGRAEQPLAIVISRSGRMPESNPLFSDPGSRILFFTSASPLPARAWQAEVGSRASDRPDASRPHRGYAHGTSRVRNQFSSVRGRAIVARFANCRGSRR
jgi:riboflavin biosynthesis pyrimidine reductase